MLKKITIWTSVLLCFIAMYAMAEVNQVTIADWLDAKGQCGNAK